MRYLEIMRKPSQASTDQYMKLRNRYLNKLIIRGDLLALDTSAIMKLTAANKFTTNELIKYIERAERIEKYLSAQIPRLN